MTFSPSWAAIAPLATGLPLMSAYTLPATNSSYYSPTGPGYSGQVVDGVDASLGFGSFVYAQMSNATGCNAGDVCELTQTLYGPGASQVLVASAQQWAGGVNSAKPLMVALSTLAQYQFGWFQVYGNALVNTNGAIVAGNGASWHALGVVQAAAVASKQVDGAQAMVANSANFGQAVGGVVPVISATQAVFFINWPSAQGAIT